MKYCPACKTAHPEEDFYQEPKRPGGLSSQCKECSRERKRRHFKQSYYPQHKDEIIAGVLRRRKEAKEPGP